MKIIRALIGFDSVYAGLLACVIQPTRRFCARTFNDIQFFSHAYLPVFVLLVVAVLAIVFCALLTMVV